MTTEDMIEVFIEKGTCAYKKLNKNTKEGMKLYRHEKVEIEGQLFNCFREYATYKMGEFLKENLPEAYVEVTLDGNDSIILLEVSDEEQQKVNTKMYSYLKEWNFV